MKKMLPLLFLLMAASTHASDRYRHYLLTQIISPVVFETKPPPEKLTEIKISPVIIPHFKRAKGAVFCRMEDYLTAKTKIWIKVGVK